MNRDAIVPVMRRTTWAPGRTHAHPVPTPYQLPAHQANIGTRASPAVGVGITSLDVTNMTSFHWAGSPAVTPGSKKRRSLRYFRRANRPTDFSRNLLLWKS